MVTPEHTGKRIWDKAYSQWHREKINESCKLTDIDWIEFRKKGDDIIAVAVMEIKHKSGYMSYSQFQVLRYISQRLITPGYLIWHNDNLTTFYVCIISNIKNFALCSKDICLDGSTQRVITLDSAIKADVVCEISEADYITLIENL